ncbi:MAG: alpha/beta hydrolase [Ignavibacteriae bacterium]|nr:alpha/beta hydrolase [Ignavibacteriota bacterium]
MDDTQLYFLPGLGFDERIFFNLGLGTKNINYLKWLEPNNNETLSDYVKRIAEQIDPSNKPLILVGHSFGGIIVQEISKFITVKKIIIISSVKSKEEIPITFSFLKVFPLYKLINTNLIIKSFPIWAKAFGYNSEKGRKLFVEMLSNSSDNYFKWAMDKIIHWSDDNSKLKNLIHIHGNRDKTFPINLIKNPIVVNDGSHFMVNSKAEIISEILNREIQKD